MGPLCDGRETEPNPCRCPCIGCMHHCAAHNKDIDTFLNWVYEEHGLIPVEQAIRIWPLIEHYGRLKEQQAPVI